MQKWTEMWTELQTTVDFPKISNSANSNTNFSHITILQQAIMSIPEQQSNR